MHERDLKDALLQQGRYYEEGLLWHCSKNYYVFIERSWLIIFCALLFSTLCILSFNVYSMLPTKTSVTFIRYTDDIHNEISIPIRLYDLYRKNDDLQTVVEKYLISKYVEAWGKNEQTEGPEDNYVKLNSSHQVYEKFLESRRKEKSIKTHNIKMLDIQIKRSPTGSGKVATAKVRFYRGEEIQEKVIRVAFRATDVLLAHRNIISLELIVSGYEEL
ncbi:conjugal transfer protein TraJ [Neorickettsia helminthoeca]|nr:conjugal transfer protein TraJ [Neorickettsia helminthoeca]